MHLLRPGEAIYPLAYMNDLLAFQIRIARLDIHTRSPFQHGHRGSDLRFRNQMKGAQHPTSPNTLEYFDNFAWLSDLPSVMRR